MAPDSSGGEKPSIVILGPAHPLRGGLASYNERLAREFMRLGWDTSIYTFSLQYPGFLFPGKTQYSTEPPPEDLRISVTVNSVNPVNWLRTGQELREKKPDIIVVRYWLPFMGPALGTILRQVKKNRHTRIICIADNVIPHEKRPGDTLFTRYFLGSVHACITMSDKVWSDLRTLAPDMPAELVPHPLYDNFGEAVPMSAAREKLGIPGDEKWLLFFGFIRHYKGLDMLLEAMADPRVQEQNIHLLVAGEFYEDEAPYRTLLEKYGLRDRVRMSGDFIADSDVRYYLCAGDCVVQPYRSATQSGVTPLAYHFEKPMIVTRVGGLPALVPEGRVGLIAEPLAASLADKILEFYQQGAEHFIPHIRSEKKKYSWEVMANAIIQLAGGGKQTA